MVDRGIVYMLMGTRHAIVTAVSVRSLRRWHDGELLIYADESGLRYAEQIADAAGCGVEAFEPKRARRNSGYANKPRIPAMSPYRHTIQLDGDTLVTGSLDDLWPWNDRELVLTQFADWITTGSKIRKRVAKWKKVAPREAQEQLDRSYPAINTGVLAYGRESKLAREDWDEMTARMPGLFIADELAMQMLIAFGPPDLRILDDGHNWSPLYGSERGRRDPRVLHFHGKKHCHAKALPYWFPEYQEATEENYAGMADWPFLGDKRLRTYLEKRKRTK